MCLELRKGYSRRVANKDIGCYKIGYLRGKEFSPFIRQSFRYKPNMLVESKIEIIDNTTEYDPKIESIIEVGLHSYANKTYTLGQYHRATLMEKYHKNTIYDTDNNLVIGIFIIPEKANYYKGIYRDYDNVETPSYASNKIIWTGKYYRKIGGITSLLTIT